MEKQEFVQEYSSVGNRPEGFNIDSKRILYYILQYWYLIILSLLLAIVIAYLKNRYAERIYPVTASIIIKDAEDFSGGEFVYDNPLVNYHRNYLNEPYIIKSYPLIEDVLKKLNFSASFYKRGNFLTTEVYDFVPIDVFVIESPGERKSFDFTVLDKTSFSISPFESGEGSPVKYTFGDTISVEGIKLVFQPLSDSEMDSYINKDFVFTYTPVKYLTGYYVGKLKAEWAEKGAGVIKLTINGTNPKKEVDFLSGLIKNYQEYNLKKKNQTALRTVAFITEQLEGISDSLRHVEQQLQRFKNQNVVTDLNGEALRLYQKLEEVESQKTTLIVANNYYQYLIDYLNQNRSLDQIILPSSVGISDPILTGLISKMTETQLNLKMMKHAENPLTTDARNRISEIKSDIVESIKNQRSTDEIKLNFLNKQIKGIERQLEYLPGAERQLVSIQRNYSLLENLYIFLLQKRSEAAITQASNTSDIIVVNPPMVAEKFIAPKITQNYIIAGFLGIVIPLSFFVLIEIFNTRIQSREDIEKITTIPFIGGVGHKLANNSLEALTRPKTSVAESFRALRSNLNYFLGKQEKGVFLITSSISGEGKTFTTVNLASILALSGKKTLIVGADMRKPRLFDDFNLKNERGLSTFLAGMEEFEQVVQKTPFLNLDLISGGPVPPNPSELLLTKRMDLFLEIAKKHYDYVIIDTPPLAIVTDAFVLSAYVDHTLFIVRQNYTPKDFLRTVEDFYSSGRLRNISIVLNDIYRSGPGYGFGPGYGLGYYGKNAIKGYYSDEAGV